MNAAVVHHRDPVPHRQRLHLIVRDVDSGRSDGTVDLENLGAHLHAQMSIEVGQRLIEQKHGRIAHDGSPERDALALAARKLTRSPIQKGFDTEHFRGATHLPVDLISRNSSPPQTEGHVVVDGHVRVEAVILEHHRDVPVADVDIVDAYAVEVQSHRR